MDLLSFDANQPQLLKTESLPNLDGKNNSDQPPTKGPEQPTKIEDPEKSKKTTLEILSEKIDEFKKSYAFAKKGNWCVFSSLFYHLSLEDQLT